MRRHWIPSLLVLLAFATVYAPANHTNAVASGPANAVAAKKKCKTVISVKHGKKTKKKVCTKVKATPTLTPAPTATPTATATPTQLPEAPNLVRQSPAFPGAPPGGFIPGASITVTSSASFRQSKSVGRRNRAFLDVAPKQVLAGANIVEVTTSFADHLGMHYFTELKTTVADGRGFRKDQKVCLFSFDAFDRLGCSTLDTLTPAPQANTFPNAVVVSLAPFVPLPSFQMSTAQVIAPFKIVVVADEIALPITPGTPFNPGETVRLSVVTPAGPITYAGAAIAFDDLDRLIYVPEVLPFIGASSPFTSGFAGNQLVPPGAVLNVGSATASAHLTVSRMNAKMTIDSTDNIFNEALDTLRVAGAVVIDPADIPTAFTVDNCADCLITILKNDRRTIDIFNPAPASGFWNNVTIRFGPISDPSDPVSLLRSQHSLGLLLYDANHKPVYALSMSVIPFNPEPVVGPIKAEFVEADRTTYYTVTAKTLNGNEVTPYDQEGNKLNFFWSYDPAGIQDAVKCGNYGPDRHNPDNGAFWMWEHPSPLCPHTTPYHPGVITVLVRDGGYACTVKYKYGSRGMSFPEYGDAPTKCDYLVG